MAKLSPVAFSRAVEIDPQNVKEPNALIEFLKVNFRSGQVDRGLIKGHEFAQPLWPEKISVKRLFARLREDPVELILISGALDQDISAIRSLFDYPEEVVVLEISGKEGVKKLLLERGFLSDRNVPWVDHINYDSPIFKELIANLYEGVDPAGIFRRINFPE